ncbi:MAG: SDR family oxidoreductase [Thermoleophilia bacterium]|nr:SDR family oxidoreductase [Thermoleophilia bacterium]
MKDLEGKTVLVTGAGSGIGRAVALAFAEKGSRVVISDIDEGGGQETASIVTQSGGESIFVKADVTHAGQVDRMTDAAIERFGSLDAAVNNAGVEGVSVNTVDLTEEVWDRVIAINLKGVWLCMRNEIGQMLRQGKGSIVNMASILGIVGYAKASAYTATKHGVIGLTRAAALEYAAQGIRINAICPGFIDTPMLERSLHLHDNPELQEQMAGLHPVNRLGKPEEVAAAALWLCSDASAFVTGHPMLVDGGYVAR